MSSAGRIQDLQSRRRDLRLALLLYKVVMGHVGIQPEDFGLVAADDRTRAKHQFKFHAVQVDVGCLRTVKCHLPLLRYSTRRTVNYLSEQNSFNKQNLN